MHLCLYTDEESSPKIKTWDCILHRARDSKIAVRQQGDFLTHLPMTHFQPTMHESSHECDFMWASRKIVQRLTQTPFSMTTPGPTITLGPMRQFSPITAVGSWDRQNKLNFDASPIVSKLNLVGEDNLVLKQK